MVWKSNTFSFVSEQGGEEMIARIEFEVEDEDEFNKTKDVSMLEGETWTLVSMEVKR